LLVADHKAYLLDVVTGKEVATLRLARVDWELDGRPLWNVIPGPTVRSSPDGRYLALEQGTALSLFGVERREEFARFPVALNQFAFSPDGSKWAVKLGDRVRIHDANTGKELLWFGAEVHPVTCLHWSTDGTRLALGQAAAGGVVKLWDVPKEEEIAILPSEEIVIGLSFSPGDRYLGVRQGGRCLLWDLIATPPRFVGSATEGQLSAPDDTVLVTVGERSSTVDAWTISKVAHDGNTWGSQMSAPSPTFTPDGKMIVLEGATTAFRGTLGNWLKRVGGGGPDSGYQYRWVEVGTWKVRATLDVEAPGTLSPDGRLLAVGGNGSPIRLWRVPPRRPLWPVMTLMVLLGVPLVVLFRRLLRRGDAGAAFPPRAADATIS
jgi:WD40 repeat protein